MCSAVTPNFDRMVGNKLCKQIDWDCDPALVTAWEMGRTGYPFIDAIMNQLRTEGWMHHLARHAVGGEGGGGLPAAGAQPDTQLLVGVSRGHTKR